MCLAAITHIRYLDLTHQQLQAKLQAAETERARTQKVSDALMRNTAEQEDIAALVEQEHPAASDITSTDAATTTAAVAVAATAAPPTAVATSAATIAASAATSSAGATAGAIVGAAADAIVSFAADVADSAPAIVSSPAATTCASPSAASVAAPAVPAIVASDAIVARAAPRRLVTPVDYGLLAGDDSSFVDYEPSSFVMLPYYFVG